jgi:thiol-disulfide isomerase/thioredoxin
MKKILILSCTLCSLVLSYTAQSQYITLTDSAYDNAVIKKGILNKKDVAADTAYHWYAESQRIYHHPDSAAVAALRNNSDKINFIIFGGTWCEDTHFVLPKFFMLQEASGFPESRITLFGVDRKKTSSGNIAEALNIINVPTIIVMKNGKELGRVVEYGKTGKWDKELADIINGGGNP